MKAPDEDWRPIPGFPGYEASSEGNVRSFLGARVRVLKKPLDRCGYEEVCLRKNNANFRRVVHRLVLESFSRPRREGETASHLNGNKRDNRLKNLCWESIGDNNRRKIKHGSIARGSDFPQAAVSERQVIEIRAMWASGKATQSQLAKDFGVSRATIWNIVARKTWAWLLPEHELKVDRL